MHRSLRDTRGPCDITITTTTGKIKCNETLLLTKLCFKGGLTGRISSWLTYYQITNHLLVSTAVQIR